MINIDYRDYREISGNRLMNMIHNNTPWDDEGLIQASVEEEIDKFNYSRPAFTKCKYMVRRDRKHVFPSSSVPQDVLGVCITTGRFNNRIVRREFYLTLQDGKILAFHTPTGRHRIDPSEETPEQV